MPIFKKHFSNLKSCIGNRIINLKNKIQNGRQKLKESFYEAKNKPRSKRKSLFLGFVTVLGIFGVTLLAPVLPAVAKDLPKKKPNPEQSNQIIPSKPTTTSSQELIKAVAGIAGAICTLAVSSGSFLVGVACGVVVVVGILKAQGK